MSLFDDMMDVEYALRKKKSAKESFDKICDYLNRVEAEELRLRTENDAMRKVINICGELGE